MKTLIAVLATIAVTAGCAQKTTPQAASTTTPAASRFATNIDNTYWPLVPGTVFHYVGQADGEKFINDTTVTHDTITIDGVKCVVVHDVVKNTAGRITEDTFDWYAQDAKGNVWYYGEDTKEIDEKGHEDHSGSWKTGVNGAKPGIVMEASPQVGDSYRQEYLKGEAEDHGRVLETDATVTVAGKTYRHVLVTQETTPLEPGVVEEKNYAPGVGDIMDQIIKGGNESSHLVSVDPA